MHLSFCTTSRDVLQRMQLSLATWASTKCGRPNIVISMTRKIILLLAGLGTMGFGVPAGLGAQLGCPDRTVITVSGDGSIMMNIQELATLNRYQIPLKIVLLDNGVLGMVRQWQEVFFDENYSEVDLYDNPDFAKLARAFQIDAFTSDQSAAKSTQA